ncbi:MAG: type IV pilus modification PilV family protein [Methylobacter sp.]
MSVQKQPANFSGAIRQRGLSLIELVIFMVIVGIAMAGILSSINFSVQHSADPVVKKQALAIAEALLEEIELMPFTWCDPNDPNVTTATSAAGCSVGFAEVNGPETIATVTETRGGGTPFDNVNDYNGYCMATVGCGVTNIQDITGAVIPNLNGYAAFVTVGAANLNNILTASGAALHITVTVTGPLNTTVLLEGYRTRYTPQEP